MFHLAEVDSWRLIKAYGEMILLVNRLGCGYKIGQGHFLEFSFQGQRLGGRTGKYLLPFSIWSKVDNLTVLNSSDRANNAQACDFAEAKVSDISDVVYISTVGPCGNKFKASNAF